MTTPASYPLNSGHIISEFGLSYPLTSGQCLGIATGVPVAYPLSSDDLLNRSAVNLKTNLVQWFEFEGSASSSGGGSATYGWVGSGSVNSSRFNLESSGGKIGSGYLSSLQLGSSIDSWCALRWGNNLGVGSKGTLGGWIKEFKPTSVAGTYTGNACLLTNTFTSLARTGVMGVAFSGTYGGSASFSFQDGGGSGSTSGSLTSWTYFTYWYDFTDTTAGANGTEYFCINNGTVYSKALPAKGSFTYLQAMPMMDASWTDSASYPLGVAIDGAFSYDRILSSGERSSLYNGGSGRNYASL